MTTEPLELDFPAKVILAAQNAIDGHTAALGLETDQPADTNLYHLLRSLVEWSEAQTPRVDFDLMLEQARDDIRNDQAAFKP